MTDYIKREDAIEGVCKGIECQDCPFARGPMCMLRTYLLHTVPTADVVEVVRCKDCKYYNPTDHCYLQGAGENDFCSYGERAEA